MKSLLFITVSVALLLKPAAAQDIKSSVKAEIERQQHSLNANLTKDQSLSGMASSAQDLLKAAAVALDAGNLYLALEKLAQASDLGEGARFTSSNAKAAKGGLTAFQTVDKEERPKLLAVEQELKSRNWTSTPAAIRALAEAARVKTIPLIDGGKGFAEVGDVAGALFYTGQARGKAEFAKFCATLTAAHKDRPWPARSLLPELLALQDKVNAAFVPPRSIDMHPRFISLNASIKTAREMDAAHFYDGELYQYLEAVRHYGMLDAKPPDAARQKELKQEIASLHSKREASAHDDSIAVLFLERASSQIAHADGSAPSTDELKSAAVIVEQVLPAYDAAAMPLAPIHNSTGKTIDITLVRWPYT